MSYARFHGDLLREEQLFTALLELTYRCNLDCWFCYNDLSADGRALSRDQYLSLVDDLAEMGTLNLVLSGGEPLSHPDFFEIGAHARRRGFVLRIKSNGHALRGRVARRVREEIDPFQIDVSLHGGSAQTHDRQTRVPGSFDRLLANIDECRGLGLRIKINATLTRWNEHEVEAFFDIAERLGCELQVDPEVTPRDDGDLSPLDLRASEEGIRRLFRIHLERSRRAMERAATEGTRPEPRTIGRQDAELMKAPASVGRPKHCGAGSVAVAVDPFGEVYPCVQWRRSIGNLHRRPIREIWADRGRMTPVREVISDAAELVAAQGEGSEHMAFCPGLAHSISGDPLEIYDGARQRMRTMVTIARDLGEGESSAGHRDSPRDRPAPSREKAREARRLPVLA